jgi:hypothetical protein
VGSLIEYPSLLGEPDVQEALSMLEGASARTVAALSESLSAPAAPSTKASDVPHHEGDSHEIREKSLDTSTFLAQIPPAIQAFAAERLAAPQHATREEAWHHLLENARKLRNVILKRETVDISRETYRAAGDWEASLEHAREAQDRVREKLGVTNLAPASGGPANLAPASGGPASLAPASGGPPNLAPASGAAGRAASRTAADTAEPDYLDDQE